MNNEEIIEHKIKLVHAKRDDFIEFAGIDNSKGHPIKKFKLKYGVPFWLRSVKGHIENNNYVTDENTDLNSLKAYFKKRTIFTLKNRWDGK